MMFQVTNYKTGEDIGRIPASKLDEILEREEGIVRRIPENLRQVYRIGSFEYRELEQ